MTRNETFGVQRFLAIAVTALLVTSGLSGVVGAASGGSDVAETTEAAEVTDVSPAALAQDNETSGDNETTAEGNETDNATASVTFEDQPSNGSVVVVNETNLSDGGFVAIFAQNGTLLGNSSYLESGSHENVTVELNVSIGRSQVLIAVPHMDTNDNQLLEFNATEAEAVGPANATDGPYLENSVPVSAVSFVTVGNETVRRTTTEARSAPR